MTIHSEHPFDPPTGERDPLRRLRGRLATSVTCWAAGVGDAVAALTVASTLVAEPDALLGLVGGDSDLLAAVERTGRFAVSVLEPQHRALADEAAGLRPAPGGVFALHSWQHTDWGPVPAGVGAWAGCQLLATQPFGFARLVLARVERAELAAEAEPLLWHRGRYRGLD